MPPRNLSRCLLLYQVTLLGSNSQQGIVNLGNLLAFSPPRTTVNLLICSPGAGRARLKIAEICVNLTMPRGVSESLASWIPIRFTSRDADSEPAPQKERPGPSSFAERSGKLSAARSPDALGGRSTADRRIISQHLAPSKARPGGCREALWHLKQRAFTGAAAGPRSNARAPKRQARSMMKSRSSSVKCVSVFRSAGKPLLAPLWSEIEAAWPVPWSIAWAFRSTILASHLLRSPVISVSKKGSVARAPAVGRRSVACSFRSRHGERNCCGNLRNR